MVPKTIGLAAKFKDVRLIGQAINQRRREPGLTKDLGPVRKCKVGGDNRRHAFVECRAKLKQQLRARRRKGNETQFIQNNQLVFERESKELG